jgi:acyl carrier protein phosphodiesterase
MNFLAHLYLTSGQPEQVTVGNFLADAVKGKKALENYEPAIQKGIRIHRAIDDFTDKHPLFKRGTRRLHGNFGKFSPIILDIFYDHILARHWGRYSDLDLQHFADQQYALIARYWDVLPAGTRRWYDYMSVNNLLFEYSREESIEKVLQRMDERTGGISGMGTALSVLKEHREIFTLEFQDFFEEIRSHLPTFI